MRYRPSKIKPQINYADLIKPLSEKADTSPAWVSVISNVQKDGTTPPSVTPTPTNTTTPTPTASLTPTPTITNSPTPTPSSPPIPSIEYNGLLVSGADTSIYNFTGLTASTTGLVALGIGYRRIAASPPITITGVTINGVEANIYAQSPNSYLVNSCIATANITATTYDVQIRLDGNIRALGFGYYLINNIINQTPYFANVGQTTGEAGFNVTANTSNNVMIASGIEDYVGGILSLNGITLNYNTIWDGFGQKIVGGGEVKSSPGEYLITISGTNRAKSISVIAWE